MVTSSTAEPLAHAGCLHRRCRHCSQGRLSTEAGSADARKSPPLFLVECPGSEHLKFQFRVYIHTHKSSENLNPKQQISTLSPKPIQESSKEDVAMRFSRFHLQDAVVSPVNDISIPSVEGNAAGIFQLLQGGAISLDVG